VRLAEAQAKAADAAKNLSLPAIVAFSSATLPLAALAIAMSVYLPRHFAAHLGISLTAVGGAFAMVRLLDVGVDLVLGIGMDRTKTRLGRYRAWMILGVPILVLSVAMLFLAPAGISMGYLIGWLLVLYLGTSILGLAHTAWAANLLPTYNDRARVFAVITAVSTIGSLLVLGVPQLMTMMGRDSDESGVQAMGWLVMVLVPLTVAIATFRTPEHINLDHAGARFQLSDYWRLITRPSMARIMLADLCLTLGPGWMSALYLFFWIDVLGFTAGQASLLLAISVIAGLIGAPLMGRLAIKISKHRAVIVATTLYSLMLLSILWGPRDGNFAYGVAIMATAGFLQSGFGVILRAMTADVADEVRLEQGKERAGLLFALTTLTTKISSAFAIWLSFSMLAQMGYQPEVGAHNTAEAVDGLKIAYLSGPIVFVMLGGLCCLGYSLSAEKHAEIRRQLDERDALYNEAPIIESITGEAAVAVPAKPG
jgi:GPH family glycoside/pentoside/hexuronide:cation symporter